MEPDIQERPDAWEAIRAYVKPVFGFALNRLGHREEAEDLAQEILLQLLKSAAAGADVRNTDAYVWTVARYTWVHWLKKHANAPKPVEINGMSELLEDPRSGPLDQLMETEGYRLLRREIGFLSDVHRRVVVLHYYEGLKVNEIASVMKLPVNTVKWHLTDARKELRRGMRNMRAEGNLSLNPVRFEGTGHTGTPGILGETNDFLGRPLAQNIVYAAYGKARTVADIARELGMPPALLEAEVRYLADYGFLSETAPGKYRSNTIVWDETEEQSEESHRLYRECAAEVSDVHFEALMDARKRIEESGVEYPDGDYNFLLWTLLPKNAAEQSWLAPPAGAGFEAVAPMRKDGGHYIAYAKLIRDARPELSFDPRQYEICGAMNRYREGSPLYLWQINTHWSDRKDWRFLTFKDVELCHAFRVGYLPDIDSNREAYSFLLEKGYIRHAERGYAFNAVWLDSPKTLGRLNEAMPDLRWLYAPAIERLHERLLKLTMRNQPKHLEPQIAHMVRGNVSGGTLNAYLLKHLLDKGKLKVPLLHQRKTITTWMGPVRE